MATVYRTAPSPLASLATPLSPGQQSEIDIWMEVGSGASTLYELVVAAGNYWPRNLITGVSGSGVDAVDVSIETPIKARYVATTNINIATGGISFSVDDSVPRVGDIVLLTEQSNPAENGLYVANSLTWTRSSLTPGLTSGTTVIVEQGISWGPSEWVLITPDPITIDVTPLSFVPVTGSMRNRADMMMTALIYS
jgi:hypothetical protein